MKKNFLLKLSYLLLYLLCISSCEENDSPQEVASKNLSPTVLEAMNFLKTKKILLPDMHQATHTVNTRSVHSEKSEKMRSSVIPDWNSLQTYRNDQEDVRLFLLKENTEPLSGFVYTRIKGKEKRMLSVSTSKLALWKVKGKLIGRIITYLPDRSFLKDGNNIAKLGYKLEGSKFSGICLVSTLEGAFLYGDKFNRGKHVFHFVSRQNWQQRMSLHKNSIVTQATDSINTEHIYVSLFSQSDFHQPQLAYYEVEEDDFTCMFCGGSAEHCNCIVITPDKNYCPLCGAPVEYCRCFSGGNSGSSNNGNGNGNNNEDNNSSSGIGGGGGSGGGENPGGDIPDLDTTPNTPEYFQKKLEDLLPALRVKVINLGANIGTTTIRFAQTGCSSNARLISYKDGGIIEVCQEFFRYDIDDQASIIWHELFHLNHDNPKGTQFQPKPYYYNFYSEAPSYIIADVDIFLKWRYKGTSIANNPNIMLSEAKEYLTVRDLLPPEYYQNEINTYKAEIMDCTNISTHYSCEREFNYWKVLQLYELAKKHY